MVLFVLFVFWSVAVVGDDCVVDTAVTTQLLTFLMASSPHAGVRLVGSVSLFIILFLVK